MLFENKIQIFLIKLIITEIKETRFLNDHNVIKSQCNFIYKENKAKMN